MLLFVINGRLKLFSHYMYHRGYIKLLQQLFQIGNNHTQPLFDILVYELDGFFIIFFFCFDSLLFRYVHKELSDDSVNFFFFFIFLTEIDENIFELVDVYQYDFCFLIQYGYEASFFFLKKKAKNFFASD